MRTIFVKKSWYFLKIKFSYSVDNIGKILIICESIILNVFLFYYYLILYIPKLFDIITNILYNPFRIIFLI